FHLANTEFFQQLLALRSEKHVLVVERREGKGRRHHNGDANASVQLEVTSVHPLLPPSASFSDTPTPAAADAEPTADADGQPRDPARQAGVGPPRHLPQDPRRLPSFTGDAEERAVDLVCLDEFHGFPAVGLRLVTELAAFR